MSLKEKYAAALKLGEELKVKAGDVEIVADIKVEKTDIYGYWTVKPGESLSKIAKDVYDNASLYMKIFEANKDQLKNPDMIHPGQKLALPNK